MAVYGHRCPFCRGSGALPSGSSVFVTDRRQQRLRIIRRVTSRRTGAGERRGVDPEAGAVRGGGRAGDGGPGGPLPFDTRLGAAVDAHLSDEGVTARLRRERRAAGRADAVVWVPPVDAPEYAAPGRVDRFGRAHRAGGGRRRSRVPMRAVVALWAHGFGADAVTAMVEQAGVETSSSASLRRPARRSRAPRRCGRATSSSSSR